MNRNKIYRVALHIFSAVLFALLTYLLRLVFFGSLDVQGLYIFFLIGVIASAWLSGFLYGLVTAFVSLLLITYFFIIPSATIISQDSKDILLSCIYIVIAIVISFLAERMHYAMKVSKTQKLKLREMRTDLMESTEKIQILMDSIGDVFVSLDSKGNIIYLNHQAENLFRTSKESVIGKSFWELMPNSIDDEFYNKLNTIIANGESTSFDNYFADEDAWLEIHTFPTLENNGIALYLRDITESKRREEQMMQNEEYYKKFVNSNVIGIIIADMEGKYLDVNDAFLNIIGYTREEFEQGNISWEKVTTEPYISKDLEQREVLFEKGLTDTYEKQYLRKDGTTVPTLVARLLIDREKGICLSYVLDISERKQNEERLKESEQRFRNMADSAPGMIWMTNTDNLKHYFNKRWLEFRGRSFEDEYGIGWIDGIHEDDKRKVIRKYEKAFETQKEFEVEYRLKRFDDQYRWVLDQGLPRLTPNGRFKGFIGMALDITERKEVQEQLKESKDQLQVIFQNVADAVTVQDENGKTLFFNDKAAEMLGFQTASDLLAADPSEIITEVQSTFEIRDEGGNVLSTDKLPGARVLKGEHEVDMVFEFYNKIEKKSRWFLMKSRAILDDEKTLSLAVNIISDITDSKIREKQKDEFMSIASHELKTPITTIKAFTQILLQRAKMQNDEQSFSYLSKMDSQVNNLTNLVGDLLDVSRIQAGKMSLEKVVFDINQLLNETLNNLQMTYPSHKLNKLNNIELFIYADKRRIEQVIINLINNAVKYSPNSDRVDIKINKIENNVSISIQDYGIGINKKDQKKIFQRFYVSEANKENRFFGLGLGLFISSEIIRRHRGVIEVESEKGKGSRFIVKLPLTNRNHD